MKHNERANKLEARLCTVNESIELMRKQTKNEIERVLRKDKKTAEVIEKQIAVLEFYKKRLVLELADNAIENTLISQNEL